MEHGHQSLICRIMENLHPNAQVALVVMGGIVVIVCFTAIFTDFWDNIGRKR